VTSNYCGFECAANPFAFLGDLQQQQKQQQQQQQQQPTQSYDASFVSSGRVVPQLNTACHCHAIPLDTSNLLNGAHDLCHWLNISSDDHRAARDVCQTDTI